MARVVEGSRKSPVNALASIEYLARALAGSQKLSRADDRKNAADGD